MARALSPTQTYDITFTAVAIALQAEVPFVLIGTPGEGKTSSIKGIGESLGWPTEVVPIPGKRDPAMIQGLPRLDPETLVTKWMPFEWIKRLEEATKEGKRSILMLDDIAEGTRDMQSYFLGVIADRILGDVELSRTSICGAANPEGDQLQVTTALANRLCHINWALTPQEFAALARSGFKTPDVPKLEERWRDLIPTSREAYAAFCETLQGFHQVNPDGKSAERLVGAFPSPRTWDMGGRLLAALDSVTELPEMKRKYVKQLLLNSAVGREAAGAFFTWAAHGDLPKPADVLANPGLLETKKVFRPDRPDRAWVVLWSVSRYVLFNLTEETWRQAWRILGQYGEKRQVGVAASTALVLHHRRPEGVDKSEEPDGFAFFRELVDSEGA